MEPAVSLNHGCSLSNFHIYCQSCYLDFRYQKCYILKLIFFYYILQKEELDLLKGKSDKDLWEEDLELFLKTLDVSHEWFGGLGLWCLTPLSTLFQFYWWRKSRVPVENHLPAASQWQTLSHNVSSTPHLGRIRTHIVVGDWHWLHTIRSQSRVICNVVLVDNILASGH
jgi:hypothetical protein